jgi:hypothetical protein
MSEIKVSMRHVRQAAMCSRGARAFFRRHGLDWDTFLREGLDADVIRATGDAMAIRVAEIAEAEHGR